MTAGPDVFIPDTQEIGFQSCMPIQNTVDKTPFRSTLFLKKFCFVPGDGHVSQFPLDPCNCLSMKDFSCFQSKLN